MSDDADVITSNDAVNNDSRATHTTSTSVPHTAVPKLNAEHTVILINTLVDVSHDNIDYTTLNAALLAVVRNMNSNHELPITLQTIDICLNQARSRLSNKRSAYKIHNRAVAQYNDIIAAETASFQNKHTRRSQSQIEKIISLHRKPKPPVDRPLDEDYQRAIDAIKIIRKRISQNRKCNIMQERENRPQSTLTVASSADDQKSEEKSDPTVEAAILNGKTTTKQIRGNMRNLNREGLANISAAATESKQQFDRLFDVINEMKSHSAQQTELAKQQVQLVAEAVRYLRENREENEEIIEPNEPKRRRRT